MDRLSRLLALALVAGALLTPTAHAAAAQRRVTGAPGLAQTRAVSWQGLAAEVPRAFNGPTEIGVNAVSLTLPGAAAGDLPRFEIVLAMFDSATVAAVGGGDAEVLRHFKATFVATARPATATRQRSFLGATVTGEELTVTIPRRRAIEAYVVALPGGARLGVAFRYPPETDAAEAGRLADAFAASLRRAP